jgi:hypothetical protein
VSVFKTIVTGAILIKTEFKVPLHDQKTGMCCAITAALIVINKYGKPTVLYIPLLSPVYFHCAHSFLKDNNTLSLQLV